MRYISLILTAVVLAVPSTVNAKQPRKVNRYERLEAKCSQHRPKGCIEYAVFVKRIYAWRGWMHRVAMCESRLNPYAHNPSGASGLFQFLPGTFASTPYRWRWIYSAKWNALAAAWMVRQGRSSEWVCG